MLSTIRTSYVLTIDGAVTRLREPAAVAAGVRRAVATAIAEGRRTEIKIEVGSGPRGKRRQIATSDPDRAARLVRERMLLDPRDVIELSAGPAPSTPTAA